MSPAVTHAIEYLILPPGGPILLLILGILLFGASRTLGFILVVTGTALIYLASVPAATHVLLDRLEHRYPALQGIPEDAQAIVVLGAGRDLAAEEFGGDTVNAFALQRLRYAARLHRESRLPVLVTGGRVYASEGGSEARLAAKVLEQELGVPARWVEEESRNTFENARYSHAILNREGIDLIVLVTNAFHMPRAVWSFRQAGFEVIPAPTGAAGSDVMSRGVYAWIPQARALLMTRLALHEFLGLTLYQRMYR